MTPSQDPWFDFAACKGMPQSLWFDRHYEAAKKVCQVCPVRSECLTYAAEAKIEHGCWGGKSPRERGVRNAEPEYIYCVCVVCETKWRWTNARGYSAPKCCSSSCRRTLQSRIAIAARDVKMAG